MATINVYKVHYHFESKGGADKGRKSSPDYIDYVGAVASDYDTIAGVLTGDGQQRGPGKIQITSVQTVGIPGIFT